MTLRNSEDTICALATGNITAAISVMRISGPDAFEVLHRIFRRPSNASLSFHKKQVWHGFIVREDDSILDEVVVLAMKGPNTFTGENVVEISCHGGRICRERIYRRLLGCEVRAAEPGEFTLRAFLNGKMGLVQAEALDGLIHATCDMGADEELFQIQGGVQRRVKAIRMHLLECIAELEVHIDFPEEDIPEETRSESKARVRELAMEVSRLHGTFQWGRMLREGIRTTIIGRPNVGKSSLLNALLKRDRAIVSKEPGTTRDIIEETIVSGGLAFVLRDTAGLRETSDQVEVLGTSLARQAKLNSDLLIIVVEASTDELDDDELSWLKEASVRRTIFVANKADLPRKLPVAMVNGHNPVFVSAQNFEGVDGIVEKLVELGKVLEEGRPEEGVIMHLRQRKRLDNALTALKAFDDALMQMPIDISITHLYEASEELGTLTGEILREDVLKEIFGRFCIGK